MNGLRMYQEAVIWRAADKVLSAAAQAGVTLSPSQTNPSYFCALAANASIGTPMAVAKPYCAVRPAAAAPREARRGCERAAHVQHRPRPGGP